MATLGQWDDYHRAGASIAQEMSGFAETVADDDEDMLLAFARLYAPRLREWAATCPTSAVSA